MAVWGNDFPTRPTINKKKLRTEEQMASYTYSLADTLTFELQDKYLAEYTYLHSKIETEYNDAKVKNYQENQHKRGLI
jgi:NH3-dependent NAD+ synthetase